jgi:hypothetical protein
MKGTLTLIALLALNFAATAQCAQGEIALDMVIYSDAWGYETYWELVPGTNNCGDGTVAFGSNAETVGCTGGGEGNANGNGYPNNAINIVPTICLEAGEFYTLYFVDDWGDGGLTFELYEDGNFTSIYVGQGAGSSWTFQAGNSGLPPHDSPCSALEVFSGDGQAVELSNVDCMTQPSEVHPPAGDCQALGFWCDGGPQRTVWAKFVVPDENAYIISTCNPGTTFDTQIAVYAGEFCFSMSTFQLVSANDDSFGGCTAVECAVEFPECVNTASAAFLNTIEQLPSCCSSAWSNACQNLYNSQSDSCTGGSTTCAYILNGFDSFADGWNDGFVTVTINGNATNYTFYEGGFGTWPIEMTDGDVFNIAWTSGGWPEEVSFELIDANGSLVFSAGPSPSNGNLFSGLAACSGAAVIHPNASSCFINCLPAGTVCYIQIDGYNGQTGNAVLTIKPYLEETTVTAFVEGATCPGGFGAPPEGTIVPLITGWGTNYASIWTYEGNFFSNELYLPNAFPGDYVLTATNDCGTMLTEAFTIPGPDPFFFANTVQHTCEGSADGAVEVAISGGTAPYTVQWQHPDGSLTGGSNITQSEGGMYFMFVTDAAECEIMQAVTVEANPLPTVDLGDDLVVCPDFSTQLTGPEGASYLWSTGAESQTLLVAAAGLALGANVISLTATSDAGCSATDNIEIFVETCVGLSETETADFAFELAPNPAVSTVRVSGFPPNGGMVALRSTDGRLIEQLRVFSETSVTLSLDNLPAGCYFIQWEGERQMHAAKLMIAR